MLPDFFSSKFTGIAKQDFELMEPMTKKNPKHSVIVVKHNEIVFILFIVW